LKKIKLGFSNKKQTTVNVGLLQSGTSINTIPELTQLKGEVRSYQKSLFEKNLKNIKEKAYFFAKKYQLKIKFKTDGFCPGYQLKKNDPLIKIVNQKIKQVGLKPKFYSYSGISDANILNDKGIKTVVLSDGVENPHTTQEKISLESLEKMEKILTTFLFDSKD
jgi:Di- and tripeptidases